MPQFASNYEIKLLRFGLFEVDLAAGELRKNGTRIRLQEQPFQVLTTLLQNAGRVVTRDQLRETIWPSDTFVDFDHSLNTAVNKIRDSLGDSASSPRFIETLPRRGYRFIAPVERVGDVAPGATALDLKIDSASSLSASGALHSNLDVPPPRRWLVRGLFALIQVMYLIFYLNGLGRLHAVDRVAGEFLPGWSALLIVGGVLVTGAVGIPLRFYLLSGVAFDFRRLGEKFTKLFPFVLALDQLWALSPFLLVPEIGAGLTFAAVAGLLYVPYAERTLVRMGYPRAG